MTSQWIDIKVGDKTLSAYHATPPTGKGPGIVLIQEMFGVNAHIRALADQYALDGYSVLAPDVFWRVSPRVELGYSGPDFARGSELYQKTDFAVAVSDLAQSADWLRNAGTCTGQLATLGYCMGGLLSYLMATRAGIDAAVCYYGGGISDHLGAASSVTIPMLFHFAENDRYIPASAVAAAKSAFADRAAIAIHTYAGVDHGFNCWQRPAYNQRASAIAHGRTLSFLAQSIS